MLDEKTLLITGGTGSFGKNFIRKTLKESKVKKLIVFSRDEMKQWDLADKYRDEPRLKFEIGDVRDKARLVEVLQGVDYVIHAAATKIVPLAEANPAECIRTNIIGAMNLIEAVGHSRVSKVVALSTDKASSPINLYGASKLASDKLFIAANQSLSQKCIFSIVRYGNVLGSRGSVIPFFLSIAKGRDIPITDSRMTRFMIDLDQGVELVLQALDEAVGGEIFVKKIPSMNIIEIAKAVAPGSTYSTVGIRAGEKLHEQMIGVEDAPFTYEYQDYYKILPNLNNWASDPSRIANGVRVTEDFSYTSDNNSNWMTIEKLKIWIKTNNDTIGLI